MSQTRRASDVRINEVDLTSSIVTNSNATMATPVVSGQGPLDPTYYSSFDDFKFDFGAPNAAVSFDHYSVRDYFNEGNSLWAARAAGAGYKHAAAIVKLNASQRVVIVGIPGGVKDPLEPDWASYVPSPSETALYQITSKRGPGSYGNSIALSILSETVEAPTGVTGTLSSTGGEIINGTQYEYRIAALSKTNETLGVLAYSGGPALGQPDTSSITLNWSKPIGAVGFRVYRKNLDTVVHPNDNGLIAILGAAVTTFIDQGQYVANPQQQPITTLAGLAAPSGIFVLNVYDLAQSSTRAVESWTCSVTEQTDEIGAQMEITQRVNPFSKYIRVESNVFSLFVTPVITTAATPVAMTGGASGAAPTSNDINGAVNQFSNKELYVVDVFTTNGRGVTAHRNLDALATKRYDSVAFGDVPSTKQSYQDAVDYRNLELNLNSSFSALFCSDLLENDADSGKILYVPPSGAMASLYARTSRIAQPWFSIAGLNRGLLNVLSIRNSYDDDQATYLYQNQVNYMRKFVGKGIPLWEQSTLYTKNSALQFLNVRFLLNVLKRSAYDYLIYALQEPGDDILRKQIQFSLETYLTQVKNTRGIKSYRVVITDVNNPVSLTSSGILSIAIIITPILAVREIRLTMVLSKEGMEITEEEIASL